MNDTVAVSPRSTGELMSGYRRFEVPPYQREYSWGGDEVTEFWGDIIENIDKDSYFLGLVILTKNGKSMTVIDGQQRLVTLTLLAKSMYNKAIDLNRKALAEGIENTLLKHTDYTNDDTSLRISFADKEDNKIFRIILDSQITSLKDLPNDAQDNQMIKSFKSLDTRLDNYLKEESSNHLGKLTEFIIDKLYFAVFVHPNDSSAYRIFEVINNRGLDLTPADLLKNHVLSEIEDEDKRKRCYDEWQSVSKEFSSKSYGCTFVQYIKHVVCSKYGHIPSKDLYDVITGKKRKEMPRPTSSELHSLLQEKLNTYRLMDNPSQSRYSEKRALEIFSAFNSLDIVTVRPILLALCELDDGVSGMEFLLRLVVRRMIVGNIGIGIVERLFNEVAREISISNSWQGMPEYLAKLNPDRDEFISQLAKRSFNIRTLSFARRSVLQKTITPDSDGHLHWIWNRNVIWNNLNESRSPWATTIGNSVLMKTSKRSESSLKCWNNFVKNISNDVVENEIVDALKIYEEWTEESIKEVGKLFAEEAADVWYD